MNEFINQNFLLNVALGQVNGVKIFFLAGNNAAVETGSYQVLWKPGGTTISYPLTEVNLSVTSSSIDDTSGGTGAREIYIEGLNGQYKIINEKLIMNGITPVVTKNKYIRVNLIRVSAWGSVGKNVGDIQMKDGANIIAQAGAGNARSEGAVYTTPDNHILLISGLNKSVGTGKEVHFHAEIREPGYTFEMRDHTTLYNSALQKNFGFCAVVKEKSDIWLKARAIQTGGIDVSASMYGLLINTKEYRGLDI